MKGWFTAGKITVPIINLNIIIIIIVLFRFLSFVDIPEKKNIRIN